MTEATPYPWPAGPGFNPTYSEAQPEIAEIGALQGDNILEFGAPWCGHCLAAAPAIQAALAESPSLAHIKVYDGKGKRLGRHFKVKLWPTIILLRNGEEIDRLVRPTRKAEVAAFLDHLS